MSSTNPLPVSNATRGWKGKACASTPSKLPTTSAPSLKKQGGRKVGARAWTIKDYLLVFRIISVVRPAGSNQWEIVGKNMMVQSSTVQSGEVCKNCWVKVLKLPKPTGQSKMHPLHCLALAVNKSISKSHAIGLLDNSTRSNFKVPLLNEDAKVKDDGANSNTKNADNNCAGNKAGPNGDLSESWLFFTDSIPLFFQSRDLGAYYAEMPRRDAVQGRLGEIHASAQPAAHFSFVICTSFHTRTDHLAYDSWAGSDDKAAGEGAGSGAGEGTGSRKDNGEEDWIPISTTTHPCAASKSPLWGLHLSNVNTTTPLPSNAALLSKAPTTPKPPTHSSTGPAPFPMLKLWLNKAKASLPSKAASDVATNSPNRDDRSKKATLEPKPIGWRVKPKASSSNNIIDLISDDNGEFISNYLKRQEEGNFKTIAYMQLGWKVQQLEKQLAKAHQRIRKLELKLIEHKIDKRVQERVKEALAQHAQPPATPASSVPMQYFATSGCKDTHGTINDLEGFDPLHPFNK
ncbi:hypothetical protein RHS01_01229 [Rhizoctonia solani]|uniref:Myb-like domain-containing protein n=1 Tax=Rhizoctonia solani TaxID=456999 RepID=A0A8H7IJL4_9AGAM|nr:hypothetical protein RHS01_01229 [Rhizoctonia solani]